MMLCAIDAMQKKDVFGLLVVWNKMSFYTLMPNCFRKTGIYPFSPEVLKSLAPESHHVITESELSSEQEHLVAVRDGELLSSE